MEIKEFIHFCNYSKKEPKGGLATDFLVYFAAEVFVIYGADLA